jgi:hypothetical protein
MPTPRRDDAGPHGRSLAIDPSFVFVVGGPAAAAVGPFAEPCLSQKGLISKAGLVIEREHATNRLVGRFPIVSRLSFLLTCETMSERIVAPLPLIQGFPARSDQCHYIFVPLQPARNRNLVRLQRDGLQNANDDDGTAAITGMCAWEDAQQSDPCPSKPASAELTGAQMTWLDAVFRLCFNLVQF